jgi:methylenetetrahydrofolate dehydrogenase (NADP+)/methenyltetrahydrofolate cyclohydrolase
VIDIGTTHVKDPAVVDRLLPAGSRRRETFARRGSLVFGDVHPEVEEVAGALSPVPGGVGPLTIAMLLKNTVRAAHMRLG